MVWLTPLTLTGDICTLVPLEMAHHDALVAAVSDGELWRLWYTMIPEPSRMKAYIEERLKALESGQMFPFVVIENKRQKVVGMTTYLHPDASNRRLEIGATWYAQSVQRTGLNTCAKLLLLTHAFESLHCIAVEYRTHAFNYKSRAAIERLGAKLDGILRNHMVMKDGTLRDTYVYSILQSEWPTVKVHLHSLLSSK